MKKILFILLGILIIGECQTQVLRAQTTFDSAKGDSSKVVFSGLLGEDSRIALSNYGNAYKMPESALEAKKSPLLAGFMSIVVPGAGEVYTKQYIKAAAFLAVEVAAIVTSVYYNKKGDDATTEFKDYATAHWSPVRYAEWLNKYASSLPGGQGAPQIPIDPDQNKKPWERVNFDQIRRVEEMIGPFSHRIENYGEQQYYEVIGKYKQFMHGWDTAPDSPEYYYELPQQIAFSDMFLKPDKTYYKYASTAVAVVVINHLLSAADAIWSASRYNKSITIGMNINQANYAGIIDYYPQLNLSYRF
ncbi:MAG: hypothetical protein Q8933_15370 [Bacteroidota bacterium]|nr:hypothetical protein [Bacteroidota bacterium]MDP4196513.1 hypothetical protein [Bacteroidota bacterium]